jgi:oligopeptide transport system substrate-binding protein
MATGGVEYLLVAGDAARKMFAYSEAIEAYDNAQLILREKGDHEQAARTLMKLGLTYHNIFAFDSAQNAYEQGFIEWRQAAESSTAADLREASAPHPFRSTTSMSLPDQLDPSVVSYSAPIWFINQLFSGLLQLTAGDEALPDVAESWEVLDGGRTYVFRLRSDVNWSDGRPVTAVDFAYAWKRALHPDNDQGMGQMLFDISGARAFKQGQLDDPDKIGIQAIDSHTLVVNLEGPSSYFLQIMASFISRPVPAHVVERHGSGWTEPGKIVTNGPFRLESVNPGRSLLLERYAGYHGRFKGNLSQAKFDVVKGTDALQMYERDELDIVYPYYHVSFEDAKRFIQLHPDDYISQPDPTTRYLALDVTRPPFDDPRVRQALVLATDRKTLAGRVTLGSEFPAGGGYVPPTLPGHVPGIALPYDPAMAGQKLAEAGFPGGRGFPVVEGLYDSASHLRLMEHLAAHWETILGIQVSVESLDYAEFADRLERAPPNLWTWGWSADYPDPDSYLRYANWLGHGGWQNERYETLVEESPTRDNGWPCTGRPSRS